MIEFLFFIYLISGSLKGILYAFYISTPVDFTVLTGLMLVIAVVAKFIFNRDQFFRKFTKERMLQIIPFFLFYTWCILTFFYDRSSYPNFAEAGGGYPLKKIFYFLTCVISFLVPAFYSEFDFKKFSIIYIAGTIFISLFFIFITPVNCEIVFPDTVFEHRFLLIKQGGLLQTHWPGFNEYFNYFEVIGNHLINAQMIGVSLLLLLSFRNSLSKAIVFSLLLFILLSADGRGPTILFVFCLLVYFILRNRALIFTGKLGEVFSSSLQSFLSVIRNTSKRKITIFLSFNLALLSLVIFNPTLHSLYKKSLKRYLGISEYSQMRSDDNDALFRAVYFGKMKTGDPAKDSIFLRNALANKHIDTSILARELYIKNSIKLIFSDIKHFLIGYGIGNFAKVSPFALIVGDHPHNVFLEIFVETGLIGFILFAFFLFRVFKSGFNQNVVLGLVVLYMLLNCLKSIPLVDRSTFGFYSLLLFYPFNFTQAKKTEDTHEV